MREIKFRAWDDVREKMYFWDGTGLGQAMPHWVNKKISIMQFTGLKDKNGKDIYEGDIVRYAQRDNFGGESSEAFEVHWAEESCGFRPFSCDFALDGRRFDYIEVIGNKFKNPELLEESK